MDPDWVIVTGFGVLVLVTLLAGVLKQRGRLREEAQSVMMRAQEQLIKTVLDSGPPQAPPDWQIQVWTPEEREALGINDTIRFIDETEKILNPPPLSPEKLYARGGYTNPGEVVEVRAWDSADPVRVYSAEPGNPEIQPKRKRMNLGYL